MNEEGRWLQVSPNQSPEFNENSSYGFSKAEYREPEYAAHRNERGAGYICGLRRVTFWLIVAFAVVIVIAAAVGGGVGGALSSQKSSSNDKYVFEFRKHTKEL